MKRKEITRDSKIQATVTEEQKARYEQFAKEMGNTVSNLIVEALDTLIKKTRRAK